MGDFPDAIAPFVAINVAAADKKISFLAGLDNAVMGLKIDFPEPNRTFDLDLRLSQDLASARISSNRLSSSFCFPFWRTVARLSVPRQILTPARASRWR